MSDTVTGSVLLLSLYASSEENVYLTNASETITYDNTSYASMNGLEIDFPALTGGMDADGCTISGLIISTTPFLTQLSNHMPFSSITVKIIDAAVDLDTWEVDSVSYPFEGLVYQAEPRPLEGLMSLSCRGWKYYTDTTAGIPCTEHCGWRIFGGTGCSKEVHEEDQVIESIIGHEMTIEGPLEDSTTSLFNKGYIEKDGVRIKIKYHSTGLTFQMSRPPPDDWIGETVTIYAGCDRTLNVCRNIHDNESRFLGLGYSMVDYNALYEGY